MFTRTHQYRFPIPKEHLKYRLVGNHLKIHSHEFAVLEDEQILSIMPNVEELQDSRFPITQLELKEEGNATEMIITSKMPVNEAGGQIVALSFCVFFFIASLVSLYFGHDPIITITLCGISLAVFLFLFVRLQTGYFDYVRRIQGNLKDVSEQITTDVRRQLFKHKRS
jgi:hypothetical protein